MVLSRFKKISIVRFNKICIRASFLYFSDTNKILKEQLTDSSIKDSQLANILGTHLLKKLAVSDEMKIDSGYSDNSEDMQCPCGCKTYIKVGDNSMGNDLFLLVYYINLCLSVINRWIVNTQSFIVIGSL
jgi:hypothetical protein